MWLDDSDSLLCVTFPGRQQAAKQTHCFVCFEETFIGGVRVTLSMESLFHRGGRTPSATLNFTLTLLQLAYKFKLKMALVGDLGTVAPLPVPGGL